MKLKRWNGSSWVQDYPEVNVDSIVASGTPSASTYLRGDGSWATPTTHTHEITDITNLQDNLDSKVNKSGDTITGDLVVDGNVGIGTTAPTEKLEVVGDVRISGNNNLGKLYLRGDRDDVYIEANSAYRIKMAAPSGLVFETDSNANGYALFDILENGTSRLQVNEAGNVGIGTTSPTDKLDVYDGTLSVGSSTGNPIKISSVGTIYRPGGIDFTYYTGSATTTAFGYDNTGTVNFAGSINIAGDIIQQGSTYETHAEQVYTTQDKIYLRDGAVAGLGSGETVGLVAKLADGTNDAELVFDGNGTARVGDSGDTQALATREDSPVNNGIPYWNDTDNRFDTSSSMFFSGGQLNLNQYLRANGLANYGTFNNAYIYTGSTGTTISRNIADANSALKVNQANASSTGDIADFQFGGSSKAVITSDGIFDVKDADSVAITQNYTPILSTFNYGDNGTVTTVGQNTFVGLAGNTTMGSTATETYHGSYNTAVGHEALKNNTTGSYNTATGRYALRSNTAGSYNTANGLNALYANTTGSYNTANGLNALYANTTGSYNTANGLYALYANTTGSNNTANGLNALYANTTGSANTANGKEAGRYIEDGSTGNTTGDYNIFIGAYTKALADNDQNEIVIGYNAIGNGSNSVTLGNDSITKTVLKGNVGIGTTSPAEKLDVSGNIAVSGTVDGVDIAAFKTDYDSHTHNATEVGVQGYQDLQWSQPTASDLDTVISALDYAGYNLENSIPTVNNATITMKINGSDVGSFTTNQSFAETIDFGTIAVGTDDVTLDGSSLPNIGAGTGDNLTSILQSIDGSLGGSSGGTNWTLIKSTTDTINSGTTGDSFIVNTALYTGDVIAMEVHSSSVTGYTSNIVFVRLDSASTYYNNLIAFPSYISTTLARFSFVAVDLNAEGSTQLDTTYAYYSNVGGSTTFGADTVYIGRVWKIEV